MDKYYILRIGIAVIFIIWLMIPTSNENICKNISEEMSIDRSQLLDSITKLINKKEMMADTVVMGHWLGQKMVNLNYYGSLPNKFCRLNRDGVNYLRDNVYKLNPMPYYIRFYRIPKTVEFSFGNRIKISARIKVIYMDNKIDFSICEYREANYPPWHLKHWVYEIRPQWYILHNKNTNKFIQYYDSMRRTRK